MIHVKLVLMVNMSHEISAHANCLLNTNTA